MIKGIIFDMDGTILDTESILVQCWIESAAFYGFEMQMQHALAIRSLQHTLAEVYLKQVFGNDFDYVRVRQMRKKLFAERIEQNGIRVKEGVLSFLQFCKKQQFKTVVATATAKEVAVSYLKKTRLLPYFTDIVGGDQITSGKPFPSIYQTAAAKIYCKPEECIALEDAPNGILSAFYAGCHVIMIPDLSQPEEMLKPFLMSVQPNLNAVIPLLEQEMKNYVRE